MSDFAARLLAWFERHGRRGLPWQRDRDPYRIWVAEVMLQQTQVAKVITYYERFLRRFPDVAALAAASEEELLALWAGLGYYRRALSLLAAARLVCERHGGSLPRDPAALRALPGIGRNTAGAILAQAFGLRQPILDGNARRVLARHAGLAAPAEGELWRLAEERLPRERLADYTQALMDLGALLCRPRRPRCEACPVAADCRARLLGDPSALPRRRRRAPRPLRRVRLLLEHDAEGRVRLVRRPPLGYWPRLLSLPECDEREEGRELPGFRHDFTHFRLEASLLVRPLRPRLEDAGAVLAGPDQLAGLALPAPLQSRLRLFWELEEWRGPSSA
ncbi:MAG: A/G-specific adenine glycosylase [Xanthomonadales bacterium]|nr:A/G-specific adenine glycosylase [Xanthomonadales bacterium]